MERVEHLVEHRALPLVIIVIVFAHAAGVGQKRRNTKKLPCGEHAAALRAGQCLADIVHAGKRWAAPQEDHLPCSVRFILQPRNVINVRAGLERKRPRLRRFAHGLIGQLLKKLRKFQHAGGFFKEFCHS